MSSRTEGPALLGRNPERAALEDLLRRARQGESAVMVVRGEAGIGKSALLRHVADRAAGLRILRVAGVESEMELPFAGLHQLCVPMLDRLDALPAPQKSALGVALGLAAGDPPDRFLVALGALSLLAEVADRTPLLVLVEDAQWLDGASQQVLGFVARRLLADPVAVVFAARPVEGGDDLGGLPELALGGLNHDDSRALLGTVIPGRLDDRVSDRIVAETRGNPLALLELPRGLSLATLAGGFGAPDLLPLTGRIEESFLRRLDDLPDQTRLLLLVAAAEPLGDPALMWRAAAGLDIPRSAIEPASRADLLHVGTQVRFRHPLVRSAVYRAAPEPDRRRVHAALADATDATLEPDRRAWHRAHATGGPDEDVAAELERSAGRAQARGGLAAAAAFLTRAADLSLEPARRGERLLAAVQATLHAGDFDKALGLLAAAQAAPLDELGRARVDLLHAGIAFAQARGSDAPALLLSAARRLEALDVGMARDTYLDAWSAALFAGSLAAGGGYLEVSEAALAAPRPRGDPRPSDLLLEGFSCLFTSGRATATPVLQRAATAFACGEASAEEVLRWGWLAVAGAVYVWDYDSCLAVAMRAVELARGSGALEVLVVALNVCGQAASLGGDFASAERLVAEAEAVTEATGTLTGPYAALVLGSLRGREASMSRLVADTVAAATAGGQGTAVQYAHWAHSVLLNGLGRHEEAQRASSTAVDDTPELFVSAWALGELVEAAHGTGDQPSAHKALARLDESTGGTDAEWALAIRARCHALLADTQAAEPLYREAINRLARTRLRPELARSRLLYGEWLRRVDRRDDAREQLRAAHDAFVEIGAEAFTERAARGLRAAGETVRRRTFEAADELTSQEAQIARLAASGHTNPEIGAQLFLSPRTVEWHLRNVFAKLGVSSRRELHHALPEAGIATGVR